jgi:phosphotransacetylase
MAKTLREAALEMLPLSDTRRDLGAPQEENCEFVSVFEDPRYKEEGYDSLAERAGVTRSIAKEECAAATIAAMLVKRGTQTRCCAGYRATHPTTSRACNVIRITPL